FGAGWSLEGLQQLIVSPDDSVLLIDGDGNALLFQPPATPGQPYVSPAGDFSTLERLPDGTFRRTLTDQTVYLFDNENRLILVRDRNGNQTSYSYNNLGQFVQLTDPAGLHTDLAYAGNLVTITDPANRITQLELDTDGNLVQLTNPDGSTSSWTYDARHLLT